MRYLVSQLALNNIINERIDLMSLIEIIWISIGLSLDIFAVMVCKGAVISKLPTRQVAKSCAIFAIWQVLALVLGDRIAILPNFADKSQHLAHSLEMLSGVIFAGLGILMIYKGRNKKPFLEKREDDFFTKILCFWAFLTSIDAFFAGIGFGFLRTKLLLEGISIMITTVLVVILGLYTGYRFGFEHKNKAYILGGILLLAASINVFIKYF